MNEIEMYSYAKINLLLDVVSKREDNYHNIRSVMQSIDLKDSIRIKTIKKQIIIECNNPNVPLDEKNTVYKAIRIIKDRYNIDKGVYVSINKIIPTESGMAGGSGNASAVIKGLNKIWDLKMDINEMCEIGLMVGADVPFCLMGGTALVEGIGEKVTKLNSFKWDNILIVKPKFSISTAKAYQNIRTEDYNMYKDNKIIQYINDKRYEEAAKNTANVFEKAIIKAYPEVTQIKETMIKSKAISSIMTGSGSAIFGLFENGDDLLRAKERLKNKYENIYVTKTNNS